MLVVPAVPQYDAQGIGPRPEIFSHVVHHIFHPAVVPGHGRIEHMIADPAPVDIRHIIAQTRNVETGRCGSGIRVKFLPEPGRWEHGRHAVALRHRRNPAGLPVLRREQAHFPPGRIAVGRGLSVLIPYTHFPVAALAGLQRNSPVRHVQRLYGRHPAAVPQIGRVLVEPFRKAGD
jgi:hypothetical protein